jgi:hypothetical protein
MVDAGVRQEYPLHLAQHTESGDALSVGAQYLLLSGQDRPNGRTETGCTQEKSKILDGEAEGT